MTPTKAAKPKPRCLVRGSISALRPPRAIYDGRRSPGLRADPYHLPDVDEFFLVPHIVKPGETISSTEYIVKPGGKGANQAYAIARAGGSVDLHGAVGRDGLWVKQLLQNAGAGVDQLRVLEGEVSHTTSQCASDC
jgi:ribokinase